MNNYFNSLLHVLQFLTPTLSNIVIAISHFLRSKLVTLCNQFTVAGFTMEVLIRVAYQLQCIKGWISADQKLTEHPSFLPGMNKLDQHLLPFITARTYVVLNCISAVQFILQFFLHAVNPVPYNITNLCFGMVNICQR